MDNDSHTPDPETPLRRLRVTRGMSQKELGDLLGLDQGAVSRLERGLSQMRADHVRVLARHFNVSANVILGLPTDPGGGDGAVLS